MQTPPPPPPSFTSTDPFVFAKEESAVDHYPHLTRNRDIYTVWRQRHNMYLMQTGMSSGFYHRPTLIRQRIDLLGLSPTLTGYNTNTKSGLIVH